MNIFTKDFNPPMEFANDLFCVFPTNQKYYMSDYVAVMNNREMLRIWSQSNWPEDDFTPQVNKAELGQHVEDNVNHTAYGYMLYSPDRSKCFGSLYVNPLTSVAGNYHASASEADLLHSNQARIDCWIIEDASDLEKEIIASMIQWFKETWKINVLFSARVGLDKRISIYQNLGLEMKMNLKSKTSDMTLLLF